MIALKFKSRAAGFAMAFRRFPFNRDGATLLAIGLALNALVALLVNQPGYPDAYYYFNGAQRLLEGYGFRDPYLWNYLGAPDALPAPAFIYWQPLPSLVGWAGMVLFGNSFDAAQVFFVLIAAALPLVTFDLMQRLGGSRRQAWQAALLTVCGGFYLANWTLTEAFAPFALAGSLALVLMARARASGTWRQWALAGGLCALGHLSRADGLLLLLVGLLVALYPRHDEAGHLALPKLSGALALLAGYLVVMAPWFARNIAVMGSPLPSGGMDTLWLVEYNDLFTYGGHPTLQSYLASGWDTILAGKGRALMVGLGTLVAVQTYIFMFPLALVGWRRRWREPLLLPALVYGLGLYTAMTLAFTFPGMRGGLFHSSGALLPFTMTAGVLGLDDALAWAARRGPAWRGGQASKVFGAAAVGFAAALSGYLLLTRVVGIGAPGIVWNQQDVVYGEIGDYLDEHGAGDAPVMVNNPSGFYYFTGRGGVPVPNGDEETLLGVANVYSVEYVVIDVNVVGALGTLYGDGPQTGQLKLEATFQSNGPVYLYRIVEEE